ncbi:peptide chain release factor H [Chitinimonas sp.]|uniref:peptide chain release factor H n=1 Tax=Chitinimonas sp. TaxID=1934313 RepID=UPI0035AF67D1
MILLQLSAAQGPAECALAVAKAVQRLQWEADRCSVRAELQEHEAGPRAGTLRSALISLDGEAEEALAQAWTGTVQWICPSPFRAGHLRKNWFIGVSRCEAPAASLDGDIRYDVTRSSGPGGQHVNKVETAVRATHIATGISVKVQSERSQHANKRIAERLILHKLQALQAQGEAERKSSRRLQHHRVERGSASRVFVGEAFIPQ